MDWSGLMSGAGATAVGFGLSSLSRAYRERRADLKAKQAAVAATKETEEQAFRVTLLARLDRLDDTARSNGERVARLEGAVGIPTE